MSISRSRSAGGAVAAVVVLLLAGCGTGEREVPTAQEPQPTATGADGPGPDELAQASGRPCPRTLPVADEEDGADEAAAELPVLPAVDRAWVCRYDPVGAERGDGAGLGWERAGRAEPVAGDDLAPLVEAFEGLALVDGGTSQRVCTTDIGPRWMVVLADAGDLTGVVVDDFGCHDTRLTADPHHLAPGASGGGTVEGVVQGGTGVLDVLGVGARPRLAH